MAARLAPSPGHDAGGGHGRSLEDDDDARDAEDGGELGVALRGEPGRDRELAELARHCRES
jgi:hypothetical protein